LFYATGGLAYGNVTDYSRALYAPGPATTYRGSSDKWHVGWTLGAGIEHAVTNNWTVKAEYLYYDLGRHTVVGSPQAPNPPFATRNRWSNTGHVARIGINYLFGGSASPVLAKY
jgi:outer membrane immunogenic protein